MVWVKERQELSVIKLSLWLTYSTYNNPGERRKKRTKQNECVSPTQQHQTYLKTYSIKGGHKNSTYLWCGINSAEITGFGQNYINVYNFDQNCLVRGKNYVFLWQQKKNHSKCGPLVTATSPEFLGIPFHSHTHVLNAGNTIVPRIKCILQRDRERGGGAVKLKSEQCG